MRMAGRLLSHRWVGASRCGCFKPDGFAGALIGRAGCFAWEDEPWLVAFVFERFSFEVIFLSGVFSFGGVGDVDSSLLCEDLDFCFLCLS